MLSLSEFWSAKGTSRVLCWASEALNGVSGLSVFVLSELLEQFATSRDVKVSRQKAKMLREDDLFMGNELSTRIYNISYRRQENAIRVLQLDG